jgi:hypothetical protein
MPIERIEFDFDAKNQSWSRTYGYNRMFLQAQQNWANAVLVARGYLSLNEVLVKVSIPQTEEGATTGWVDDGAIVVDFGEEADAPPPGDTIKLQFNVNSTNIFRDKK